MQKTSKYYWWLQFGGWGVLAPILILINLLSGLRVDEHFLIGVAIKILAGIFITHLFRLYIHRMGWLTLPVEKALPRLAVGILIVCLLDTIIRISVISWIDPSTSNRRLGIQHKISAGNIRKRIVYNTLDLDLLLLPLYSENPESGTRYT